MLVLGQGKLTSQSPLVGRAIAVWACLSQGGCEAVDSKVSVDALGPGAVTKAREQHIPGFVVKDQTQQT